MRRVEIAFAAVVALATACTPAFVAPASAITVLVTNDDGYNAQGISVLVERLSAVHSVKLEVFAPATNQSGTGSSFTTGPLTVFSAATAAGFPTTAVQGFPADCTLFGSLSSDGARPDLIVSGINFGQNLAETVTISGTVGATLTGAQMGIPGFAFSQALGPGSLPYDVTADYAVELVKQFVGNATFRRLMRSAAIPSRANVLNVNFPTCTTGRLRGVRAVVLGRTAQVVGYSPTPGGGPNQQVWLPTVEHVPQGSNDCSSTLKDPTTDLEAMDNGFASVTMLNADLTDDTTVSTQFRRYVER